MRSSFLRLARIIPRVAALAMVFVVLVRGGAAAQAGRIDGTVTNSSGTAIAGALIAVDGTRLETESGVDGRFAFVNLRPGAYFLLVRRIGYEPARQRVQVQSGATTTVRFALAARPVELEGLTIIGSAAELAETRARLNDVPGGVALITPEELRNTRQTNFSDIFRFTPGVYAAPRFGAADESQFSIRGSGLRNNFHLRGVNLLVNGMPYRNADGFTDFESLELLTTENVQVYKGGNALRYGGSTLGGAVNFETKTGYSSRPFQAFAQGGSYGFFKGQVSSGMVLDRFDFYASYTRTQVDGYRMWSGQRRDRVNAHMGYVLSPKVDLRAFYFFAYIEENLPGSLTRDEFLNTPRMGVQGNIDNQWGRDISLHHVGLQMRAQLTPTQRLEFSPYGQFRDLVHPIFRVLDQTSADFGTELRYENTGTIAGRRSRFTFGAQAAYGDNDNRHFENVAGQSGDLAKDQLDEAANIAVYGEELLNVTPAVAIVAGLRFDRSMRQATDVFLDDGDQSDKRWYSAAMPKVGLLIALPGRAGQVFANASRSFEPGLLLELNSFTVPGFIDLEPQDAWQFEVGTRGSSGAVGWDISVFDVELSNEIININVQPFPGAPFTVPTYRNVLDSRHLGLEAGLQLRVPGTLLTRLNGGDELVLRGAYTFANYTFVDDADFGDNELPGLPQHVLNAEIQYRHPIGLTLRPSIEWVPGSYFVNSENTESNEGWVVLNARGEFTIPQLRTSLFVEVRNITNELYSPAVTVDDGSGRYFLPADARSVYAGLRVQP